MPPLVMGEVDPAKPSFAEQAIDDVAAFENSVGEQRPVDASWETGLRLDSGAARRAELGCGGKNAAAAGTQARQCGAAGRAKAGTGTVGGVTGGAADGGHGSWSGCHGFASGGWGSRGFGVRGRSTGRSGSIIRRLSVISPAFAELKLRWWRGQYTKYVTICQSIVDGSGIMGTEWGKGGTTERMNALRALHLPTHPKGFSNP